ncbi:enolase C-terminal domain-like protein [Mycena sp. CBHHK59/15]|nr:enolase C-terminal domain-like protein [Mycena sp. CBHHK59/15]
MNAVESLGWLNPPHGLDGTIECVKQVKSIGLDVGLDFRGRVHRPLAKQLAKALQPYRPLFIEEPLLPDQQQEIKALYGMTGIPIALGERLFTRQDCRPYFESGCIVIIQPDIPHSGGISEAKRIVNMAEGVADIQPNHQLNLCVPMTYDIGLAPHCPLGPIAFTACLQLGFSTPNFMLYNAGDFDLLTYMTNPEVFAVHAGMVSLLERAGLGVNVNEALVGSEDKEFREGRVAAWCNPTCECRCYGGADICIPGRGPDGAAREW